MKNIFEGGNIDLNQEVDMDTAKELGFTLMKGTTWYDYDGETMSLDQMAEMEAGSRDYAERKEMQTTVSPTNGISVSFENPNSDLAKAYEAKVKEYLAKL